MSFIGVPLGLRYYDGGDVLEGDILFFEHESNYFVGLVYWDRSTFSFRMNILNKNLNWPIYDDCNRQYKRLGSMYESCVSLPLWKMAGEIEMSNRFLRQVEENTCFPLAVMNACIGYGIEKASFNFELLKRCSKIGECTEFHGCLNERGIVNLIDAELGVVFSQVDFDSVIETGGLITVKEGNYYHAVSVIVKNGRAFLVNMIDLPFVIPFFGKCHVRRNLDDENHRDYSIFIH